MDSVTLPIWLTFKSKQLQAFLSTAIWILLGLVTVKSSPTIWMEVAPVSLVQPSQSSWSKASSMETTGNFSMKPWYISQSLSLVIQSSGFDSGFLKSKSYLPKMTKRNKIETVSTYKRETDDIMDKMDKMDKIGQNGQKWLNWTKKTKLEKNGQNWTKWTDWTKWTKWLNWKKLTKLDNNWLNWKKLTKLEKNWTNWKKWLNWTKWTKLDKMDKMTKFDKNSSNCQSKDNQSDLTSLVYLLCKIQKRQHPCQS